MLHGVDLVLSSADGLGARDSEQLELVLVEHFVAVVVGLFEDALTRGHVLFIRHSFPDFVGYCHNN